MNEPMFVESAQALGRRVLREQMPDTARLSLAFRLCVSRKPTDEESRILLELLAKQREKFTAKDADPWAVAFSKAADYRELPNHATPADAAAWTTVARVLLNLDETVTKE